MSKHRKGEYLKQDCQFNNGCACTKSERLFCETCGWNPKVIERRNNEIRQKMEGAENEGV